MYIVVVARRDVINVTACALGWPVADLSIYHIDRRGDEAVVSSTIAPRARGRFSTTGARARV